MQIRHLPRRMYRGARLASRLEAEERSDEAERCDARRNAVSRWQQARLDELTAKAAASRPLTKVRLVTVPRLAGRCRFARPILPRPGPVWAHVPPTPPL
jgi:hypothetical protein